MRVLINDKINQIVYDNSSLFTTQPSKIFDDMY